MNMTNEITHNHTRLTTREKSFFFVIITAIYLLAWVIQENLFLNWDVSVLLNAARQWLNGGSYANDFFTPNPPMILYLYTPPIILSKWLDISIVISFRIYIFLLATLSFFASCQLIKGIFLSQNKLLACVFFSTLLTIFLILPSYQFGQRDHLFLIMTVPYLFLITRRLENCSVNPFYALLIGLFFGLGIGIKPQFLLVPLSLELYYVLKKRNWLAWLRIETSTLAIVLIFYMTLVFSLHPDYLFVVVPFIMTFYYKSISIPWTSLLFNDVMFFCFFTVLFYFLLIKDMTKSYKTLSTVLFVALIGFMLTYLAQRTYFFYHLIPAFSLAILLLALLSGLFASKYRHVFSYMLIFFLFLFPVYFSHGLYLFGIAYKKNTLDSLIAFMQTQAPRRSIYMLSEANFSSPLIDYTDATVSQRYDCLWMVEYLVKLKQIQGENAVRQYLKQNNDKYFFLNVIADDLHRHQPDLIFVDVRKINMWLSNHYTHFDFLNYFLENEKFRDEWKSYRYLTTIVGGHQYYKLDVYQRII